VTSTVIFKNIQNYKCIIFLICLQFSVINILYANAILKQKQVICLENMSFGVYIYWQFFQPVIWRVADLPAFGILPLMLFAKKALEERPTHGVCENE
jgi:hypothetical protein